MRQSVDYRYSVERDNYYLNDKFAETIAPKLLMDLQYWVEAFEKMKPESCSSLQGHSYIISEERNRETVPRRMR